MIIMTHVISVLRGAVHSPVQPRDCRQLSELPEATVYHVCATLSLSHVTSKM